MAHRPWIKTDGGFNGRIFCRPTVHLTLVAAGLSTSQAGLALLGLQAPKKGAGVDRLFRWHSYLGRLGIFWGTGPRDRGKVMSFTRKSYDLQVLRRTKSEL